MVRVVFASALAATLFITEAGAAPWHEKRTLAGKIELRNSLPPVNLKLRAGNAFDQKLLPVPAGEDRWVRIPDWFAGTWRTREQTTTWARDDQTGEKTGERRTFALNAVESFGKQRDAAGSIWEYLPAGRVTETEGDGRLTVHYVTALDVVSVKPDLMVWRVDTIAFILDPATRVVIDIVQKEQLLEYSPQPGGRLKTEAATRAYNADGSAYRTSAAVSIAERLEPFKPVDSFAGRDMKKLLAEYLQSSGRLQAESGRPAGQGAVGAGLD